MQRKKNEGKRFEEDFRNSIPPDIFYLRLKDDTAGFKGVNNPCDFILFKTPLLFLLELKSTKDLSLPFSKIRDNQIDKMGLAVTKKNVYGGFIVNFRQVEETYYLSHSLVDEYMKTANRKSIPIKWCREFGTLIPQQKKRVRYNYDISTWLGGYYAK